LRHASVDTTIYVNTMVGQYEHAVLSTIDLHAPVTVRMKACQCKKSWYNGDNHGARALRRANEKRWRTTELEVHRHIFCSTSNSGPQHDQASEACSIQVSVATK